MQSAAYAFRLVALLLASGWPALAAEAPVRAAPSRPGALAPASVPQPGAPLVTRKFGGVEYVSVPDVAARLGLRLSSADRGRKALLNAPGVKAELENDTRDVTINGLRVFLGDPVQDAGGQLFVSRIDFERCLTPMLRPGFGAAPQPSPLTVVLDPGHGGKDNGTSVNEKVFALDVALRAKKILETAGYRVVLTRSNDTFLELTDRSAIANARRAGLFVSIHFNAVANDAKTSGVEVFTFAPRNQHAAEWWSAARKDDPHLETTEMPVNRFDHWSVVLAQSIHRRFVFDLRSFDRGKKLAHWGVLRQLNCPGVLIECGFLTSEAEARKIATPAHRQKLAEAIAAGIRDYAAAGEPTRGKSAALNRKRKSAEPRKDS
jgi:N-acetylmuramoyl-L-alanine amidase